MVNIEHKDVLELLDAGTCTALMERTLADLELGKGVQYLRGVTPLPSHDLLGFMPAYLGEDLQLFQDFYYKQFSVLPFSSNEHPD